MTITTFTDGGSRGNPGRSAAAFYIPHLDLGVGVSLMDSTNNVAEYMGLIEALKFILNDTNLRCSPVEIRSDSKLIVEQMKGTFQVKSESLLELWAEATALAECLPSVAFIHVPRKENSVADKIANLTMDAMDEDPTPNRRREWQASLL